MGGIADLSIVQWLGERNYELMVWLDHYLWAVISLLTFTGGLIGMSPMLTHHSQTFVEFAGVYTRRGLLWVGVLLMAALLGGGVVYDMTGDSAEGASHSAYVRWLLDLAAQHWYLAVGGFLLGYTIRFSYHRYVSTWISSLLRRLRREQTTERVSDIRHQDERVQAQSFVPSDYYRKDKIFVGLHGRDPIYVPESTWYEVNTQIIGPTRYGKGVLLGVLMDQLIRRESTVLYIDPKRDRFLPHIMYQAAKAAGRKFYYLTLHDDGVGRWAPFAGGSERDALARLEVAFSLEYTGNPGTDFYKSQERRAVQKAFSQTRTLQGLAQAIKSKEKDNAALRVEAELERWSQIASLCPPSGRGFSIAKALVENAVIYVQGSLSDAVVKTATKVFIIEAIQEAMRLHKDRKAPMTLLVDEVRFLVSRQLADALATSLGFATNIVTAYQSVQDLLSPDDETVHAGALLRSVNVNSQIKAVYGGADFETARWVSDLTGTIQKEVARSEHTEIGMSGGEIWEQERTIAPQEENLIPTNTVLQLPRRVCAFIQPEQLGTTCATAWVPVADSHALDAYLASVTAGPASKTSTQPSSQSPPSDHQSTPTGAGGPRNDEGSSKEEAATTAEGREQEASKTAAGSRCGRRPRPTHNEVAKPVPATEQKSA
jgi:type IV secretory pathway TraG/TraD family ATPase VirD4